MKKKITFIVVFVLVSIISVVSLGLNIYFLVTEPKSAGDIFNDCQESVLEIKAESETIGTSYGSGEIINKDGTIVTNAHVVTYKKLTETLVFENVYIRFFDEQDYRQVEIVKYDLDFDLAVLKLKDINRKLKSIKLGDDKKLKAGDAVYALGNMSNYGLSLTSGIVAIPHVNVTYNQSKRNVIQCDLTISDGNSGGALINDKGELVGITTFRLKDQSNNIIYGISYCIPINVVMEYI
mgnify:CR=1 FL=1